MFGAHGKAKFGTCANFVSQISIDNGTIASYGLEKMILPVKNCRNIGKKDMKLNDFIGDIQIDSETYDVKINGKLIESNYVNSVPMAKKYFMF